MTAATVTREVQNPSRAISLRGLSCRKARRAKARGILFCFGCLPSGLMGVMRHTHTFTRLAVTNNGAGNGTHLPTDITLYVTTIRMCIWLPTPRGLCGEKTTRLLHSLIRDGTTRHGLLLLLSPPPPQRTQHIESKKRRERERVLVCTSLPPILSEHRPSRLHYFSSLPPCTTSKVSSPAPAWSSATPTPWTVSCR